MFNKTKDKTERTRNLCVLAAACINAEIMTGQHLSGVNREVIEKAATAAELCLDRIENGPAKEEPEQPE